MDDLVEARRAPPDRPSLFPPQPPRAIEGPIRSQDVRAETARRSPPVPHRRAPGPRRGRARVRVDDRRPPAVGNRSTTVDFPRGRCFPSNATFQHGNTCGMGSAECGAAGTRGRFRTPPLRTPHLEQLQSGPHRLSELCDSACTSPRTNSQAPDHDGGGLSHHCRPSVHETLGFAAGRPAATRRQIAWSFVDDLGGRRGAWGIGPRTAGRGKSMSIPASTVRTPRSAEPVCDRHDAVVEKLHFRRPPPTSVLGRTGAPARLPRKNSTGSASNRPAVVCAHRVEPGVAGNRDAT